MKMISRFFLGGMTSLALCAYAGNALAYDPAPPVVKILQPKTAASLNIKQTFIMDRVKSNLRVGDPTGHYSGGMFCSGKRVSTVNQNWLTGYMAGTKTLAAAELRRLGYPEPNTTAASAFDSSDTSPPDFRIGAVIKNVTFETCVTGNNYEGWIHTEINWAIFSEKLQKIIFERTTEGLAVSEQKVDWLGRNAVLSSFDNFLADPGLVPALANNNEPAVSPSVSPNPVTNSDTNGNANANAGAAAASTDWMVPPASARAERQSRPPPPPR